MAVIYSIATKTARMQAVINQIDAGPGPGTVEIGTAGMASVLAILTLADPCGTVTDDVLTLDFDPDISDPAADATGTAAAARVKDSTGAVVISGLTVTQNGGGGNLELDNVSIVAGQAVALTTGTITHAA
jgi:hypothetical protein